VLLAGRKVFIGRENRRDYLIAYGLATLANLLVLIPQYFTTLRLVTLEGVPPFSSIAFWSDSYPVWARALASMIPFLVIFQVIIATIFIWTARVGDTRPGWRWKFRILSMIFVVYVGLVLGLDFLNSLSVASALASLNQDISQVLQTFYVFNLGAATCYLGLVLTMRRVYTRLSAAEARDSSLLERESPLVDPKISTQ